ILKQNPMVLSCWTSISGLGVGLIVKVKGIDKEHFNQAYNIISKKLEIPSDKNCRNANRKNVISYDPTIYINEKSEVFNLVNEPPVWSNSISNIEEHITLNKVLLAEDKILFQTPVHPDYFESSKDYAFFSTKAGLHSVFLKRGKI